jgi:hypothetical protein
MSRPGSYATERSASAALLVVVVGQVFLIIVIETRDEE